MARAGKKDREKKDKVSILKVIWQYVFLWPTIRTYFLAFKSVKHRETGEKEKVEIIEE
ncbi:hypothetical protein KY362_05030 [Candidatus Woesearchaeota archaeon]|nr:hypothetical protein [Candidatus Woesearchaeota archaeon]